VSHSGAADLLAGTLSLLLMMISALIHYEGLRLLSARLPRARAVENHAKVMVAIGGATVSHLVQIVLYATAYYMLRDRFGLGGFGGHFRDAFSTFIYFSAESYTSLGMGDIFPIGSLRLLTGIETLTGLLMVSWTASFTYLEMQRYWK